jgi:DNA-directed RNA polymerase
MATPQQLARQFQRELEAKREGEARLQERTLAAEERNYASATVYGQAFIREGLKAIQTEIEAKLSRITSGWATENAEAVAAIKDTPANTLALITAKGMLDVVGWRGSMEGSRDSKKIRYVAVCQHVGKLVRDEILLNEFSKAHPEAFELTQHFMGKNKGYGNKVANFRSRMRHVGHTVPKWTPTQYHQVGGWLVDRLITATGWFTLYPWVSNRNIRGGLAKGINCLCPSSEYLAARTALMEQAQRLAVCKWPMLCEPNDWSDEQCGGYLTAELRQSDSLVRKHKPAAGCTLLLNGTPALQMLNNLQRVPYRINYPVLDIANTLAEQRITVGSFKQLEPEQPPVKPNWETASDESKLEYRKLRTTIEDRNASIAQLNYRTTECLYVANKYAKEEAFWIPWSFDFRGRVYPLTTSLTPQGTDFDKSLFLFKEAGPVNPYWLAFQVATTFGLDKATMEDRQAWVKDNHSLISRIAKDPLDTIKEWSAAEEPWCFLAACVEYNDCVIEQTRQTSGIPVSVDATCSGLQHLSALTTDKSAAEMVNVVPTLRPTDAYAVVANKAKEFLPDAYGALINRKVTKRTVMTTPYGVTINSARGYIREELPKTLPDGSPLELSLVVKAIFQQAIPQVIPGPIRAMGYIQRAALAHIDQGNPYVKWVTPSGFTVIQDSRTIDTEKINTRLLGSRVVTNVHKPWNKLAIDRSGHRGGSAPNLVHSLDSALLHLTFAKSDKPFTLIHDCLLMRSCDMDWANSHIRDVFVDMYSKPILRDWASQLGVDFDDSVLIGTLNIREATNSTYFFC